MEKYYYKNNGGECLEKCPIMDGKVMIGSLSCRECIHQIGGNIKNGYINCEKMPFPKQSTVHHPQHYGGESNPFEAIKVIEAHNLDFHLGNAVKYILRSGKKGPAKEDLEKAVWYLTRKMEGMTE